MTNKPTKPLNEALRSHLLVLASQKEMREASLERDKAVRSARSAGYSTREIATHLGITQRRVQAMIGNTTKGQK